MPSKPCAHAGCRVLLPVGETYCARHARDVQAERLGRQDARRSDRPDRRWYKTAAWRKRREAQLAAEPLCRMCRNAGRVTPATVADHVTPHRGNRHLFFHGALQSLCAPHHSRAKQRDEAHEA